MHPIAMYARITYSAMSRRQGITQQAEQTHKPRAVPAAIQPGGRRRAHSVRLVGTNQKRAKVHAKIVRATWG